MVQNTGVAGEHQDQSFFGSAWVRLGPDLPEMRSMRIQLPVTLAGWLAVAVSLCACAPQPRQPLDAGAIDHEGLARVDARNYEVALIRPGIDFMAYDGLLVETLELAFRTPDRSEHQFPLTEAQKSQFRELLLTAFTEELTRLENLTVVDAPAANVLDLRVRVQDITAAVPGRSVGARGRAAIALRAAGEATLVIELRDAQSEEVLARVFDQRAVEGAAILEDGVPISGWEDVEVLCREWARKARLGLDQLVAGD